jgi:alkylation response protein AidB-like acyl-CoA dehydrogenase
LIKTFFTNLAKFLETKISPISNKLDYDSNLLQDSFSQLAKLGGLKLLIPEAFGGWGGKRIDWINYNILMAKYSGALLFLQAQHQFAISQLIKLPDNHNIQQIFHSTNTLGIALTAKRNLLKISVTDQGYLISGKLPWVTGLGFLSHILCSFDIDDAIYFTVIPFKSQDNFIEFSPIETAVFNSGNTVSIELKNYFVPRSAIIFEHPFENKTPSEHPAVYNFAGVAIALLEIVERCKYYKNSYA